MAEMLERHGPMFAGNCLADAAADWEDLDFAVEEADQWCSIGVWSAEIAAILRGEGMTPEQVDRNLIYSVCNGDIPVHVLLAAVDE
jgi:hypothetical protein